MCPTPLGGPCCARIRCRCPRHFTEYTLRQASTTSSTPAAGPAASPQLIGYVAMHHEGRSPGARCSTSSPRLAARPAHRRRGGSHRLIDFGSFQPGRELHNEFSSYTSSALSPWRRHRRTDHRAGRGPRRPAGRHARQADGGHPRRAAPGGRDQPESVMANLAPLASRSAPRRRRRRLVFTDFYFEDGFSRFLVIDVSSPNARLAAPCSAWSRSRPTG